MADPVAAEVAELVAALVGRPRWMADALCREEPYRSLPWVADRGASNSARARAMRECCSRCLARDACDTFALERPELRGTWAGRSDRERQHLRVAPAAA